ncbi:hypothetical protein GA0070558_15120 [Micromonospora haikouensis]|uniref:Uncharacterized protein n=1 Tax=Micromonospora haikouensis TaxID=686309 RepID=A0A1C4YJU5_9ACTN|nr:hypothetical protein [Micromonospora haikouensis]SCF20999.1 hypothetical protein GA0070558_15120 [Micromonospora haikouensis]
MTADSVLAKARALTAEANKLRAGAEAEENAKRVLTRVNEVNTALDGLEKVLDAVRKLRERGVRVVPTGLGDGRDTFEQLVGTGLPPLRAFATAKSKIEAARQRISTELAQAWSAWTDASLRELPAHRLVMLPPSERRSGQDSLRTLNKLSNVEVPTAGNVLEFAVLQAGLKEELAALPEPLPELQDLLRRLGQRTTLDRLTDADIALLRRHGVADQIEVQRRAV